MRVRWTTDAADDLERICDYIAESRPESARNVAKTIVDGVGILELFPNRGRAGRVEATREFVSASLPFVAIYEVYGEYVQVLRILHGAQQWPQRDEELHRGQSTADALNADVRDQSDSLIEKDRMILVGNAQGTATAPYGSLVRVRSYGGPQCRRLVDVPSRGS